MTIYRWLIVALWLGLAAYWAVSAIGAKRNLDPLLTWNEVGLRLLVVALALIVLAIPPVRHALRGLQMYQNENAALGIAGVVLCASGIGLAVFARFHLGANWGMPASRKENPELIITGPYGYSRHPIYAGIIVAMLGTTIGASPFWIVPLVFFRRLFHLQRAPRRASDDGDPAFRFAPCGLRLL